MHAITDPLLQAASRYAPEAAIAAQQAADAPWTVVVVGRVGVGKTTWINRLTGTARPVGLGGVTQGPLAVPHGEVILLDTPGIDGLDHAISALAGPIAHADAVLWVVDGLQPATRTERDLLAATTVSGQARAAIIARLDLVDADQHAAVRERLRQVLDAIEAPPGGDLRKAEIPLPAALRPAAASPRRTSARSRAIREALAALEALPPLEGRAELGRRLADRWRDRVRTTAETVTAHIAERASDHPATAPRALTAAAATVRDQFWADLRTEPALTAAVAWQLPAIPLPDPQPPTAMGMVAAAMGGEHRARVRLRELAARWMSDGLLVLAEWIAAAPGIDDAHTARQADWNLLLEARR